MKKMLRMYGSDTNISREDPISLSDISDIDSYRRFALRRQSKFIQDANLWKSIVDIYDVSSLLGESKNPMTRAQLSEEELSMIKWKIKNAENIENILEEAKTKDFKKGFKYCQGQIRKSYYDPTFIGMMLIDQKDRNKYITYVLDNIIPEDLPCYHNIDRKTTDALLKEEEVGTWLIRPSTQTNAEILVSTEGKEYESGKTFVIVIHKEQEPNINILIYYIRSLGYVHINPNVIKNMFDLPLFHTLEELFNSLKLDLTLYY